MSAIAAFTSEKSRTQPFDGIGFALQRDLGIEAVAVQAPVGAKRRVLKVMRGVEAELLGDLDHGGWR